MIFDTVELIFFILFFSSIHRQTLLCSAPSSSLNFSGTDSSSHHYKIINVTPNLFYFISSSWIFLGLVCVSRSTNLKVGVFQTFYTFNRYKKLIFSRSENETSLSSQSNSIGPNCTIFFSDFNAFPSYWTFEMDLFLRFRKWNKKNF